MWLRFLSRLAFICNVCFLIATIVKWVPGFPSGEIVSSVIVLGYLVAIWINLLVNICYGVFILLKRPLKPVAPWWLVTLNFLFLIAELYAFFK